MLSKMLEVVEIVSVIIFWFVAWWWVRGLHIVQVIEDGVSRVGISFYIVLGFLEHYKDSI